MDDKQNIQIFMERLTESQAELFGFVAAMLPGYPSDVDDVAQEVNLALITHSEEYDPARPFHAWMLVFARNKVTDFLREQKRAKVSFDEKTVEASAEWLADDRAEENPQEPLLQRLAVCRKRLAPNQQKIIDLRYTKRYPLEEIGRVMHLKLSSVHDSLAYIRRKLADCMKRLCSLSDEKIERMTGDSFDRTVSDFLDNEAPTEEQITRLVSETAQSGENLGRYLDQVFVHVALSHRFLGKSLLPVLSRRPAFWSRGKPAWIAAAAGIAGLLCGAFFWTRRAAPAQPAAEVPQPVAAVQAVAAPAAEPPAAVTVPAAAAPQQVASAEPPPQTHVETETATPSEKEENAGGTEMKNAKLAATAATALAVTVAFAAKNPVGDAEGVSSANYIDARYPADIGSDSHYIDARPNVDAASGDRKTRVIDTAKPLGTVIMLI